MLSKQFDSFVSYLCGEKNSCGTKVKYGHKSTANRACTMMEKKSRFKLEGKKFESYQCWFCNSWHIGNAININTYKFFRILWFFIKGKIKSRYNFIQLTIYKR